MDRTIKRPSALSREVVEEVSGSTGPCELKLGAIFTIHICLCCGIWQLGKALTINDKSGLVLVASSKPEWTMHLRSDCGEDNATLDVYIFGEETAEIVGTADDIGAQIGSDLSDDPAETDED